MNEKRLAGALSIGELVRGGFPADITLGEAKRFIDTAKELRVLRHEGALRVRFTDSSGFDLPDGVTLERFRSLSAEGLARVEVVDEKKKSLDDV